MQYSSQHWPPASAPHGSGLGGQPNSSSNGSNNGGGGGPAHHHPHYDYGHHGAPPPPTQPGGWGHHPQAGAPPGTSNMQPQPPTPTMMSHQPSPSGGSGGIFRDRNSNDSSSMTSGKIPPPETAMGYPQPPPHAYDGHPPPHGYSHGPTQGYGYPPHPAQNGHPPPPPGYYGSGYYSSQHHHPHHGHPGPPPPTDHSQWTHHPNHGGHPGPSHLPHSSNMNPSQWDHSHRGSQSRRSENPHSSEGYYSSHPSSSYSRHGPPPSSEVGPLPPLPSTPHLSGGQGQHPYIGKPSSSKRKAPSHQSSVSSSEPVPRQEAPPMPMHHSHVPPYSLPPVPSQQPPTPTTHGYPPNHHPHQQQHRHPPPNVSMGGRTPNNNKNGPISVSSGTTAAMSASQMTSAPPPPHHHYHPASLPPPSSSTSSHGTASISTNANITQVNSSAILLSASSTNYTIDDDKGRGSYKCGRCGVPKKGHVCPYQPKVKRRPEDEIPEMKCVSTQVEMDEFMTLRRLNIEIQGYPESYAAEPLDMVGAEVGQLSFLPPTLPPPPLPQGNGIPMMESTHPGHNITTSSVGGDPSGMVPHYSDQMLSSGPPPRYHPSGPPPNTSSLYNTNSSSYPLAGPPTSLPSLSSMPSQPSGAAYDNIPYLSNDSSYPHSTTMHNDNTTAIDLSLDSGEMQTMGSDNPINLDISKAPTPTPVSTMNEMKGGDANNVLIDEENLSRGEKEQLQNNDDPTLITGNETLPLAPDEGALEPTECLSESTTAHTEEKLSSSSFNEQATMTNSEVVRIEDSTESAEASHLAQQGMNIDAESIPSADNALPSTAGKEEDVNLVNVPSSTRDTNNIEAGVESNILESTELTPVDEYGSATSGGENNNIVTPLEEGGDENLPKDGNITSLENGGSTSNPGEDETSLPTTSDLIMITSDQPTIPVECAEEGNVSELNKTKDDGSKKRDLDEEKEPLSPSEDGRNKRQCVKQD